MVNNLEAYPRNVVFQTSESPALLRATVWVFPISTVAHMLMVSAWAITPHPCIHLLTDKAVFINNNASEQAAFWNLGVDCGVEWRAKSLPWNPPHLVLLRAHCRAHWWLSYQLPLPWMSRRAWLPSY